jgi:hypothetical protein
MNIIQQIINNQLRDVGLRGSLSKENQVVFDQLKAAGMPFEQLKKVFVISPSQQVENMLEANKNLICAFESMSPHECAERIKKMLELP